VVVHQGFRASPVIFFIFIFCLGGDLQERNCKCRFTIRNHPKPGNKFAVLGEEGKKKVPKFFGNQRYTKRTVNQSFGYNGKIYSTSQMVATVTGIHP
jgi:hypothetical protein